MFYSRRSLLWLAFQCSLGAASAPPGSLNTVIITTGGYVSVGILITTSSPSGRSFTLAGSDILNQTIPTTTSIAQSTTQATTLVPTTSSSTPTDPNSSPTITSPPIQATTSSPQTSINNDPTKICETCADLSSASYTVPASSQSIDTDTRTTSTLGSTSTDEYGTTTSSKITPTSSGTTKSSTWSQYSNHTYSNSSSFSTSYISASSSASQISITASSTNQPSIQFTTSESSTNYDNCTTLPNGSMYTVWEILPNTTTVTFTTTLGENATFSATPEFTPPLYCPITMAMSTSSSWSTSVSSSTSTTCRNCASLKGPQPPSKTVTAANKTYTSPVLASSSVSPWWPETLTTTTIITTSKNPVSVLTTVTPANYGDTTTDKSPVTSSYSDTYVWSPIPTTGLVTHSALPMTFIYNEDLSTTTPITEVVDGITLVVQAGQAVIGAQTLELGAAEQTVTEAGDVFTADSSVVTGPMIVIWVPTNTGAMFLQSATSTPDPPPASTQVVISGVSVAVGRSKAVVGGSTFQVGSGAPQQTIVVKGQTISIGSQGVAFQSTTVAPQSQTTPDPVNKVVVDPEILSVIGSTLAVIDGTSLTYGPGIPTQVEVVMGQTITIGPSGVSFDGSTLGGPSNIGTQFGIVGGLSIAEIGSSIAVINGQTFTVGPGAAPSTVTISGHTITIGTNGVGIAGGTTLAYPFNPSVQTVTAGGITFSEIGSSLAVIGGKTFTIGPGATPTTDVYNGQTISIGAGGIGFSTTTFTGVPASTGGVHTSTKSGVGNLRPAGIYGVLGICIAMVIGYYI